MKRIFKKITGMTVAATLAMGSAAVYADSDIALEPLCEEKTASGDMEVSADSVQTEEDVSGAAAFSKAGGWFESIYAEIDDANDEQVTAVSYSGAMEGSLAGEDLEYLVRDTGSGGVRIDIPGLKSGDYTLKVTAGDNVYEQESIHVMPYDRSGYAHFNYTEGVGAYRDDGTLKDGAMVVYVTDENKNSVAVTYGGKNYTGIGNILGSSGKLTKALAQDGKALDIRFVGLVSDSGLYAQGKYDVTAAGMINGLSAYKLGSSNGHMATIQYGKDVTIEGIGTDAGLDGWGICFSARSDMPESGKSFETRNLVFINTAEDAVGMEGYESSDIATDGTGVAIPASSVERCWVHNNEFYCPDIENPAESDKAQGDGSVDFKLGQYFTCSYNVFKECHKTSLVGGGAKQVQSNLTYHHNFWSYCDQRGPLSRNANIHMYNNLNYMQSGYCQNSRYNGYIFSEYNLFYGCRNPHLPASEKNTKVSPEVTASGAIKSYRDSFGGVVYSSDNPGAVIVDDKSQTIENTCKFPDLGRDYTAFDTDPILSYIPGGDYRLTTDTDMIRREIEAYGGAMDTDPVLPEQVDVSSYSVIGDKTVNSVDAYPALLNPGSLSAGYYAFSVDRPVDVEITASGSNEVILVNEAGGVLLTGSGSCEGLAAGRYMIQSRKVSASLYQSGAPAGLLGINISSLKITGAGESKDDSSSSARDDSSSSAKDDSSSSVRNDSSSSVRDDSSSSAKDDSSSSAKDDGSSSDKGGSSSTEKNGDSSSEKDSSSSTAKDDGSSSKKDGGSSSAGSGGTVSSDIIKIGDKEYSLSYSRSVSYNGAKVTLGDIRINGASVGEAIDDKLVFSKVKYKNNKNAGDATFSVILKGVDAEGKHLAKESNAKFKEAFGFKIVPFNLGGAAFSGDVFYLEKTQSCKLKLSVDTGVVTKKGAKKLCRLKYNAKNLSKSDIVVKSVADGASAGEKIVTFEGNGQNFTGTFSHAAKVK